MAEDKKVQEIVQLRAEGKTIREIRDLLSLSSTSMVNYYLKKAEYKHISRTALIEENMKLKRRNSYLENKIERLKKVIADVKKQ